MRPLLVAVAVVALLLSGCSDTETDPPDGDRTSEERPGRPDQDPKDPKNEQDEQDETAPRPSTDLAGSPDELATRLVAAERLVRSDTTDPETLEAAAFESQILYRQLARTPQWQDRVLGRLGGLRRIAELHIEARQSLRSVLSTLSDELPAWEIRDPEPTAELLRYYREGERTHGVAWELLAAINLVETGFGKIDGISTAGAQGPMQFIPSTWAAYGEGDINDPHDAILGAANYLAANGGDTGTTSGPGVENALYRYNNHQGYVDGILAYAAILEQDPRTLRSLVNWQIIYVSTIGDLWLPVGYRETAPVPVRQYVRQHPERHLGTATD
ncbi:lytic murein transglycosylase [Nocardioides antri]|uniref:Transglycosylase SLT domain-containing protein n=1 Tax=Nocardioides antri TaxID=2607659 RepID=A0A5B1MAX5_9ACTN|nr:lytic murein transglycosylase [Nocardioides antri]KAA1428860.1 transglycosylase SLT domain-containing protein [Nocardioides antri]